jgi:hypothetical protein
MLGHTTDSALLLANVAFSAALAGIGAWVLTRLGRGTRALVPVPVREKDRRRTGQRR